uniref:F-box domain-containing protein n=1 Tax=Anopheles darlingi TaxID=43151 RepID=A0A2M4CQ50_ANODA
MSLPSYAKSEAIRDEIHHNDTLPEEILCMIFDLLDLHSVKNASRTCQRWNNIIFCSGYVNRFSFSMRDLLVPPGQESFWNLQCAQEQNPQMHHLAMEQFRGMVVRSKRCYRNLKCTIDDVARFSSLWETLNSKFKNDLQSLVINVTNDAVHVLPLITAAIPLMTQLRSLTLKECGMNHYLYYVYEVPTFRSNSVKHFEIQPDIKINIEMPELESFHGVLPINFLSFRPSNMKQLTVKIIEKDYLDQEADPIDSLNIRGMILLETLKWEIEVEDESFLAICETCTKLKDLCFTKRMIISNSDVFSNLNKLVNLRRLKFQNYYESLSFYIDLSKLTELEEIDLGMMAKEGVKLPKSIKMFAVEICLENQQSMIESLFDPELIELKTLQLSFHHSIVNKREFFERLPLLKNLEELTFAGGYYTESEFLCLNAPMDRLRKLKFEMYLLNVQRFLGIEEKFPNLINLEFFNNGLNEVVSLIG